MELKACPFCGSRPMQTSAIETESVDDMRVHQIQCVGCGQASVREFGAWFEGEEDLVASEKVRQRAIERWNRRTP